MAIAWVQSARSQERTALVIANFDYGEIQLSQAKADTNAVREALSQEGFRVTMAENVPGRELKDTLERFVKATVTRGTAMVYFSGLGGQYQTNNSQGALQSHIQGAGKPSDPRRTDRESLAVAEITKLFADHSTASTNCLVIDAAAVNPFLTDSVNTPKGLAAIGAADLANDLLVLLAAQPNTAPGDSRQRSQLAAALAKHLPQGRESVGKLLEAICQEVEQQSGGKQKPWYVVGNELLVSTSWPRLEMQSYLDSNPLRDGNQPGQQWINGNGMTFCWCPPGTFQMGIADESRADVKDAKAVEVTLSKGFWIGKYEVTQRDADRLRAGGYRYPFVHKNFPIHLLSQDQTNKVIQALNETERKAGGLIDGWEYGLPTEAEWEYACRAGTTTRFSFGDQASELHRYANYADKSLLADDGVMYWADGRFNDGVGKGLSQVGSYQPNPWGLFDIHGNVAEWCADRYLSQLMGGVDPLVDPKNKLASADGVIRGGAWCSTASYCEAGFRNAEFSGKQRDFIGFRLVVRKK